MSSTLSSLPPASALTFPFPNVPATGTLTEVAEGILWARIPLPFRLDHVNIYLIEDHGGWAVLDTGISDEPTRAVWEGLLGGPLAGKRLTRVIATHHHPDHIGLAGWLCARFDAPLVTSFASYLGCINISLSPGSLEARPYHDFYLSHGMSDALATSVATNGHAYLRLVTPLPPTFARVVEGDVLTIGGRRFEVMLGEGHAPEQVVLYSAADRLLLAADQVIAKITPNISVWVVEPNGDPLGLYLRSLAMLQQRVPADALVLPGHQLPFYGLHARCRELEEHHEERCRLIAGACRTAPRSVAELVPVVFPRPLDAHQMGFAFSEVHAHVNRMLARGELVWTEPRDSVWRVALAA